MEGPSPPTGGPARRVRIEKLAPTGEGIARTSEGVGFIDRALPGELVETSIYERRRRFWRGSLRAILEPSADRVATAHADCVGCDWAHFAMAAARRAKGELFLETMQRIGHLSPALFGTPLPAASPEGYRLRTRFHVAGRGLAARVGYFAPGTHRVVDASACEAISSATRALLPALEESLGAQGVDASEAAILEDIPGARRLLRVTGVVDAAGQAEFADRLSLGFQGVRVRSPEGALSWEGGEPRLSLDVSSRRFQVSVDAFFQGNRHLVSRLAADVAGEAAGCPPGDALDAFGGVGLFAGALLSAGHRVTSVEFDPGAAADARATREGWADRDHWTLAASSIQEFLRDDSRRFDVVVVDPPRAGLGTGLAVEIARRARRLLLYVSCDPATLARDLPAMQEEGLEIRSARLYDLFAGTHRVEALVALKRAE
ncbi:MAG: TRAM domain-containing protein [Acidobacteriota bacterium]